MAHYRINSKTKIIDSKTISSQQSLIDNLKSNDRKL
jgi:hypothetical protein